MILMHKQRGSTLLVALVMLVLLTLIALSAMNATTNSIQVVGNAQFREEAVAAGQKAIETLISTNLFKSVAATIPPTTQSIDINGDGSNDYLVTFDPAPKCISFVAAKPADANLPLICSSSVGVTCYWTVWDVTAVVTDLNDSGATVAVHQGIKTIAGLNDGVAYCGI